MAGLSDTFSSKYRNHIDSELEAVLLKDFQPSELSLRILNEVCDRLGTNNALIVGGALTAEYANKVMGDETAKPRDIDIHVHLPDTQASHETTDDFDAIFRAADAIRKSSGPFTQTSGVDIKYIGKTKSSKLPYGSVSFEFEGQKVDVSFTQDPISLHSRAMYGDAIIKSIAADRNGNVMAHPFFEEDMENGEYTVRVTGGYDQVRAEQRYDNRADHLEDFELVQVEQYAAQL